MEEQEMKLEIDVTKVSSNEVVTSVKNFVDVMGKRVEEIRNKHFGDNKTSEKEKKEDKALVNKVQKEINDFRIKKEKEFMIPFNEAVKEPLNNLVSTMKSLYEDLNNEVKEIKEQKEIANSSNTIKVKYELELPDEETRKKLEIFFVKNNINYKIK